MSLLHREEKLKYAIFAIEVNRAIMRKCLFITIKSFTGLNNILNELTRRGFIKGFELLLNKKIRIFLKFNIKTGLPILKNIKLLTKTSLKSYKKLFELRKLNFHNKSFLTQLFVLSTREGLLVLDSILSTKKGGELIYQIN